MNMHPVTESLCQLDIVRGVRVHTAITKNTAEIFLISNFGPKGLASLAKARGVPKGS